MKKPYLASVALAALITTPAIAADLRPGPVPAYRQPPVAVVIPTWTWTGCYVGGHLGGLWAGKEFVDVTPVGPFFGSGDHNVNGWLGGVQAGCDYQFVVGGGWVIGIQGDYAWTSAEASHVSLLDPSLTIQTQIELLASVTGRLGYAWGRFLGYVKGGGAWERDNFNVFNNVTLTTFGTLGQAALWLDGRRRWRICLRRLPVRLRRIDFYDFGSRDFAFGIGSFDVKETKSVVKAGLNFRFGGFGKYPVAARY